MNEPWTIRMLGGFEVARGDQVATFETRKTAALLAYLAYFADRSHSRQVLADMLWPGADEEVAQNRLRQALSALRRSLRNGETEQVLRCRRGAVGVYDISTDVASFHLALERARLPAGPERKEALERACTLYRGSLLPGFDEEWLAAERAHIEEVGYQAMRMLAAARAAAGDLKGAASAALRAVEIDPLREGAHRDLMQLYAATGRSIEALRQFDSFTAILQKELGARPSSACVELAARIRAGEHRAARTRDEAPTIRQRMTLPEPASRFFGRELELSRLEAMLLPAAQYSSGADGDTAWRSRLITLTGPPGSGKTRLSIELARQINASTGRRAGFVRLSQIMDPARIEAAILESCGLDADTASDPASQLSLAFKGCPAIVVLDNFEHLVDRGAAVVFRLLTRTPDVCWVVTSRHRLDIDGEHEWPVMPLPVPNLNDPHELLLDCPSVQMFVDRALCVMPEFEFTPRNAHQVATVCCLLEGLPLAIDLVASRADVMTPGEMALDLDRGGIPAGQTRDRSRRDPTVTATIDWSYNLLDARQQTFLRRLCVFRGGVDAEAAAAVCLPGAFKDEAVEMFRQLRARSLVTSSQEAGETIRFRMLEVIRRCLWQKLPAAEREETESRHAAWSLRLAEEAAEHLRGPDQARWLRRASLERDNIRAALQWLSRRPDRIEDELRLAAAMLVPWTVGLQSREGADALTSALDRSPSSRTATRAAALYAAAFLSFKNGERGLALALVEESLAIRKELADEADAAECLALLGLLAWHDGDALRAEAHLNQSLEISRRLGDDIGIATALNTLGLLPSLEDAGPLFEESLAHFRRAGNRTGELSPLWNLACLAEQVEDYASARRLLEEGFEIARSLDPRVGGVGMLYKLAYLDWAEGDLASARRRAEEAHAIRTQSGPVMGVAATLCVLAFIASDSGESEKALRFYRQSLDVAIEKDLFWLVCHCIVGIARLALASGDVQRAIVLCTAADQIWKTSTELVFDTYIETARQQTLERCRHTMDAEAYAQCDERGRELSIREAAAYALEFLGPPAGITLPDPLHATEQGNPPGVDRV